MTIPTADWEKVGDKFYRKTQLYTALFDQDLELENYIVAGCSYAGAIALYRDENKLYSFRGSQAAKSSIDLYSSAGKLIRRINWDKGSIKGLGWSEDENLIVITADGTVRCYYDLQGDFTQFSLGNGAEEYGVAACRLASRLLCFEDNKLIDFQVLRQWLCGFVVKQPPDICFSL